MRQLVRPVTGYAASLVLTLLSYWIIVTPDSFGLQGHLPIMAIVGLALIQSLVQLIFFIDVWKEKGTYWNLVIFLATVSIIFIVVFFSIWIMDHLNYNMR
jgi:cytochrome o ubiquinol oxidase operon protein cyoD